MCMACLLCAKTHSLLPEETVSRYQSPPAFHTVSLAALYHTSSADSALERAITSESQLC